RKRPREESSRGRFLSGLRAAANRIVNQRVHPPARGGMSLNIKVDKVTAVLLADRWHDVVPGTFKVGGYDFVESSSEGYRPGSGRRGFRFRENTRNHLTSTP